MYPLTPIHGIAATIATYVEVMGSIVKLSDLEENEIVEAEIIVTRISI